MAGDVRRVCVYCGSKVGGNAAYKTAAAAMGGRLAARKWGLVYGGGSVGLMGVIADAVLEAGGEVIGVIPERLATKELLHTGVDDMRVVTSMHERKAVMAELVDAFVALPGGYGTFEELFETVTWAQLGFHRKTVGLLNVEGFFDPLLGLIDHAVDEGFIKAAHRDLVIADEDPDRLLTRLEMHTLPEVRQWMGPELA